jgi:hypothetical protein
VTAQRPITKLTLVRRKKQQQNTYKKDKRRQFIYSNSIQFHYLSNSIVIIIQFYFYIFVCQLNSPRANYKASTSERKETNTKYKTRQSYHLEVIIIIQFMRTSRDEKVNVMLRTRPKSLIQWEKYNIFQRPVALVASIYVRLRCNFLFSLVSLCVHLFLF